MAGIKAGVTVVLAVMPIAVLLAAPTIKTTAIPPPDLYGVEELWNVTLSNPDQDSYRVWLEGTITESAKGQVFWAKTNEFILVPGERTIRYADIRSIGIARQTHAPGYEQFAAQTGGLPEGDYTFAVKLMPGYGSKSVAFTVKRMGPTRLIAPKDGDTVAVKYPQFSWTTPAPMPPGGVTYTLRVFEVLPGQTPEEAIAANRPWFEQKNITGTSVAYPAAAPALRDTVQYAWQAVARTPDGSSAPGEIRTFTLGTQDGKPLKSKGMRDATIVWQHLNPAGPNWEIWFADFEAGPVPSVTTPLPLAGMTGDNMDPAVAYDRSGNAWAVWSHRDPGPNSMYKVYWSRRAASEKTWSEPTPVWPQLPPGMSIINQVDPVIAFDDNGKGFCVWSAVWILSADEEASRMCSSFWDGTKWCDPYIFGAVDEDSSLRLPEITFTAAEATGQGTLLTNHAAVVIAAMHGWSREDVMCWAWNGSGWSYGLRLPTTGRAASSSYWSYFDSPAPKPALDRLTIAALDDPADTIVTAAWTRRDPGPKTNLMACNGYRNSGGIWTWQEFPNWFNSAGLSARDVAIAVDGSNLSQTVLVSGGCVYAKSGTGSCQPIGGAISKKVKGLRPAAAWADGETSGTIAAWYDHNEIVWSFRCKTGSSWVWTNPSVLKVPGDDLNPDVAAKTGSHTMPVQ
jgi:hypothetical protein